MRRHLIRRVSVFAVVAAAVVTSEASAMPMRDVGSPPAKHAAGTRHSALIPARIEAAEHAATMRAIGAARTARACP